MTDQVRIGIIGTSGWTEFMYYSTLAQFPAAKLVAACGRNQDRAKSLAAKYAIPQVYADYKKMIAESDLDAVIIAAPDDLHYEMVMEAAKAKKHILCDKPLSLTAEESKKMLAAVQKAGVQHSTLFTYRWMPFFRYVSDLLKQGVVGEVYNAEFRYISGYARKPDYLWRLDKLRANGALGDIGSHMIDLAHWLVGDISSVCATLGYNVQRPGADGQPMECANDSAFVLAQFANGAKGSIHVSMVAQMADRSQQQQIKIYGSAGSLEFDIPYAGSEAGAKVKVARNGDMEFHKLEVPAEYWGDANPLIPFEVFTKQTLGVRQFVSALQKGEACFPTFEEGYKVQRVIEAAIIADATRSWVDISQVP